MPSKGPFSSDIVKIPFGTQTIKTNNFINWTHHKDNKEINEPVFIKTGWRKNPDSPSDHAAGEYEPLPQEPSHAKRDYVSEMKKSSNHATDSDLISKSTNVALFVKKQQEQQHNNPTPIN